MQTETLIPVSLRFADYAPQYDEAVANLNRLKVELDDISRQLNRPRRNVRPSRADALVIGLTAPSVDETQSDVAYLTDGQVRELEARQADLRLAITSQDAVIKLMQSQASRRIVESVRPQYAEIIQNLAAAALEFHRLNALESQFRQELTDADVAFAGLLPPACIAESHWKMNRPGEGPTWALDYFLDEAQRHGYLATTPTPAPAPAPEAKPRAGIFGRRKKADPAEWSTAAADGE